MDLCLETNRYATASCEGFCAVFFFVLFSFRNAMQSHFITEDLIAMEYTSTQWDFPLEVGVFSIGWFAYNINNSFLLVVHAWR